jgi:hypothetical protein
LNSQLTAQGQQAQNNLQAALAERDKVIGGLTSQIQTLTAQQAQVADTAAKLQALQTSVDQIRKTIPNLPKLPGG